MTNIGTVSPSINQDVQFGTSPTDAAGLPTTGVLVWAISDQAAGTLSVAADTLSARLVTAPGNFSAIVTVTTEDGSVQDSATVTRSVSAIAAIGLSATLVAKA